VIDCGKIRFTLESSKLSTAEIKVIFWDIGNVCVTYDLSRFTAPFAEHIGAKEEEVQFALFAGGEGGKNYAEIFKLLECGAVSPSQFLMNLLDNLGKQNAIDYETFAQLWSSIFLKENHGLSDLISLISAKHFLLSNTNHIVHSRYISRMQLVGRHFHLQEQRVLSYRVGAMKPDAAIYLEALRRAGVTPSECLFVDDLEENIDAWKQFGGAGVVYNARTDSLAQLTHKLLLLGVHIDTQSANLTA